MERVIDARLFTVEAAHIDWLVAIRQAGDLHGDAFSRFRTSERSRLTCALRWHVAAHRGNYQDGEDRGIGLPTGPFQVFRRPSLNVAPDPVASDEVFGWPLLMQMRVRRFDELYGMIRLHVNTPVETMILGLADPSDQASIITRSVVPAGGGDIELHGAGMGGVAFALSASVSNIVGVRQVVYETLGDWQLIEIVGLPVDPGPWAGVGDHAQDQGLVTNLMAPRPAAVDRLDRGCPPFGWRPLMQPGVSVPAWEPPDFALLVDELHDTLIPGLREALILQQIQQMLQVLNVPIPPPSTFDGQQMTGPDQEGRISPIRVLQVGVSSDPFLSLALGYGTNVDEPVQVGFDVKPYHDGSRFDYMVTAPYAKGLDGESDPVELAAFALRPTQALMPPMPSVMDAAQRAEEPPAAREQPYAASTLVTWQRPPATTLIRAASYAAARADVFAPAAVLLMDERPSGGRRPIAPALAKSDDDGAHVFLTDPRFEIPPVPGTRLLRYGVATQDLFGLWSNWNVVGHVATQPAPEPPRIIAATLDLPAPIAGPPGNKQCTGALTVDFTWDWTDRAPDTITLAGRLYAAAELGADPPSATAPNALQRTIGGNQPAVVVDFSLGSGFADAATVDGVVTTDLDYLDPEGTEFVSPGPGQSDRIRRYRLRIPGFAVNFATTPHVGLALWVEGRERLAPGRVTAQLGPFQTFATDPVAPPSADVLPIVPLGSMPDAQGRSHGRLAWPAVGGTAGYFVYEADEFTLLAAWGLPEPDPDRSLSERYDVIRDRFRIEPLRRPFQRLSSRAVTGTELDVVMPKGSRSIHLYVVVTAGPGGTEGPWPGPVGAADPMQLYAYAAPRLAVPLPPELLAVADPDLGQVAVELTTRTGFAVARLDLHRVRVDDAARELDTMGPPVAQVPAAGGGGWTRTDLPTQRFRYEGVDAPSPSWRRVWYRAVAWSTGDPFRGLVPARSVPSNPFSVVLPPSGPPDLSVLSAVWPGGAADNVEIRFTSAAPRWKTALGWHRLELMVLDATDPAAPLPVLPGPAAAPGALRRELGSIGTVAPTVGSALWVDGDGVPADYRITVDRSPAAEPLLVVVRMIDPLGRVTERRLDVAAGSLVPLNDLLNPNIIVIAGGGRLLTFTTDALLTMDPPYVLRADVTPLVGGPVLGGGPLRPRAIRVSAELSAIPVVTSIPPGAQPVALIRSAGSVAAVNHTFGVLARHGARSFTVTLVSPDGRTTSFTAPVPPS